MEFYPASEYEDNCLIGTNKAPTKQIGIEYEISAGGNGDKVVEHLKNNDSNTDVVVDSGHVELRTNPWAINMPPDSPEAIYSELKRRLDFYNIFKAARETEVELIPDCIDNITGEAAGLHIRVDKTGSMEDECNLINAAQANEYLFSALSNLNNKKRVEKFGFEYRVGGVTDKSHKKCNILIDNNTGPYGTVELRYIPMPDNWDVAFRMPDLVGSYFRYLDSNPSEAERNRILTSVGAGAESYAKINRDRVLEYGLLANVFEVASDEAGNILYDEYSNPIIAEIPLLDAMKYNLNRISSGFMDYGTAQVMKNRLEEYEELFEFLADKEVRNYLLDSDFLGNGSFGYGG